MNSLLATPKACRTTLRTCLLASMLVLATLTTSCKGGNGGSSSNTKAGEGTLNKTPSPEELGKAPATLIPEGYQRAQLTLQLDNIELTIDNRSNTPGSYNGTAEAKLTTYHAPQPEQAGQFPGGDWQQQKNNSYDCIRHLMFECTAANQETLGIYQLELHIDTRSDESARIILFGTATRGELILTSGQSRSSHDLAGASFILTISR